MKRPFASGASTLLGFFQSGLMLAVSHLSQTIHSSRLLTPAAKMLSEGMRLDQEKFRALYEKSQLKNVELVNGKVKIPSSVNDRYHVEPHGHLCGFLLFYKLKHPNICVSLKPSLKINASNEVQPDIIMRFEDGTCLEEPSGYLSGPPELVCEVSYSSYQYDSLTKKELYRSFGVKEYIIFNTEALAIEWFVLRDGEYHAIEAENGLMTSPTFEGLVLNVQALLERNLNQVQSTLLDAMNAGGV